MKSSSSRFANAAHNSASFWPCPNRFSKVCRSARAANRASFSLPIDSRLASTIPKMYARTKSSSEISDFNSPSSSVTDTRQTRRDFSRRPAIRLACRNFHAPIRRLNKGHFKFADRKRRSFSGRADGGFRAKPIGTSDHSQASSPICPAVRFSSIPVQKAIDNNTQD